MAIKAFVANIHSAEVMPDGTIKLLFQAIYTGPEILTWSGGNSSAFQTVLDIDIAGIEALDVLDDLIADRTVSNLTTGTGLSMMRPDVYLPSFEKGSL